MKFVDYVTITVRSGKGGAGSVAFRREKFEPRGGPWGGDGGKGGSIVLEGDTGLYTLLDLRYNRHHFADNGRPGEGSNRKGKDGQDIVLRVPIGTVAKDSGTGEELGEVLHHGQQIFLAKGGRGGLGNTHFKSPTNRTPVYAQPGEPGEEREITLELKLLADVGLVGFPNAGKSTLVSSVSAAKPKVADYPFTTLEPVLGVVPVGDYGSFVMADIPGIIEGASEGRGLGIRFLKHIERNAMLLFVLPMDIPDPAEAYNILLQEAEAFNPDLLDKPRAIVLSKMDVVDDDERDERLEALEAALPEDIAVYPISAVTGDGLDVLKRDLYAHVVRSRESRSEPSEEFYG